MLTPNSSTFLLWPILFVTDMVQTLSGNVHTIHSGRLPAWAWVPNFKFQVWSIK